MAKYVFPKTQILVRETNTFHEAIQSSTDPTQMTCAVVLPANAEAADKFYTLEVYTADKATGITATVTVAAHVAPVEPEVAYQATAATANPANLPSDGGTTTVTVAFQAPAAQG